MNSLKLNTNYNSYDRNKRQEKIDIEVSNSLPTIKENSIDIKKIYVGNIDFMPLDVLEIYTHCAFLAGLDEKLVIQDLNTYDNIVDNRVA